MKHLFVLLFFFVVAVSAKELPRQNSCRQINASWKEYRDRWIEKTKWHLREVKDATSLAQDTTRILKRSIELESPHKERAYPKEPPLGWRLEWNPPDTQYWYLVIGEGILAFLEDAASHWEQALSQTNSLHSIILEYPGDQNPLIEQIEKIFDYVQEGEERLKIFTYELNHPAYRNKIEGARKITMYTEKEARQKRDDLASELQDFSQTNSEVNKTIEELSKSAMEIPRQIPCR